MASLARIVSLVAGALAVVGLVCANLGLVAPLRGFIVCMGSAIIGGFLATVLSLVGIAMTRGGRDPGGRQKAWLGLAIGLGLILAVLAGFVTGDRNPINDITTDLENPPAFASESAVAEYAGRDMSYPADFAPIVRANYPDLGPLTTQDPVDTSYQKALATAESLGWQITARNENDHTFDAKDTTKLFRFVDDVTVRVGADGMGARVDIRSKSRDGRGDMGANAKRIQRFKDAMS